jgi:hypothetical protein
MAQTKRRPQPKPKVDLAKKIAHATPAELPQGPRTEKAISDARDLNLKGKVKSVVEYSFGPRGAREVESEKYFDEHGFLVKAIDYMEGYPDTVTVWGWVDGARVLRSNDVEYTDGEKPPTRNLYIKSINVPSPEYGNTSADERFEVRYLYSYDDAGRLTEERRFSNRGEPLGLTTYSYNGDRRDERYFGKDGSEWSHSADVIDKNGDTLTSWSFDDKGKAVDVYIYQHTLDPQGNWTAKRAYEKKTVRGKPVQKLVWTTYRTITYYP